MLGVGLPVAEHVSDIWSWSFTFLLEGALVTEGASRLSTTVEYYTQDDCVLLKATVTDKFCFSPVPQFLPV